MKQYIFGLYNEIFAQEHFILNTRNQITDLHLHRSKYNNIILIKIVFNFFFFKLNEPK